MSKRATELLLPRMPIETRARALRDGTSQRARTLPALDPAFVRIDERGSRELLEFVVEFAAKLRWFEVDETTGELRANGQWRAFVERERTTISDMLAYVADPSSVHDEAKRRWLGRPHFALLLTFIELLGHARAELDQLTRRHLDFYYRELLGMQPSAAEPDRVAVLVAPARGSARFALPAGSELQAGRDVAGNPRIYRTERELYVSQARLCELRSVYVERQTIGIADLFKLPARNAIDAFDAALHFALGDPLPGDAIPKWDGQAIDWKFVKELGPKVGFVRDALYLEQAEFRTLVRLLTRRQQPYVANDDTKALELREWGEIHRILERAGRRERMRARTPGALTWKLTPIGVDPWLKWQPIPNVAYKKPPVQYPGTSFSLDQYARKLRELERHMGMSAERLSRLAEFAAQLTQHAQVGEYGRERWAELTRLLCDARRERSYAARRLELAELRPGVTGSGLELPPYQKNEFDRTVTFVVSWPAAPPEVPIAWPETRNKLVDGGYLDKVHADLLERYYQQLDVAFPNLDDWYDVLRVLELAWRRIQKWQDPVARKTVWRNLYAYEDATQQRNVAAALPCWRPFGQPNTAPDTPPSAACGWALSSPLLSLQAGQRTLTLTLGFDKAGFPDLRAFDLEGDSLLQSLTAAWVIQVSTAKGWVELPITSVKSAPGKDKDDYWKLCKRPRPDAPDQRPALQLKIVADATCDPIAALTGSEQPLLRALLRQRYDAQSAGWTTQLQPFDALRLAAVHLAIEVDGLRDLQLQHEGRSIDAKKPFEPFGAQPHVGASLYLYHPELVRAALSTLRVAIEWQDVPSSIATYYQHYPDLQAGTSQWRARVLLLDRGRERELGHAELFDNSLRRDVRLPDPLPLVRQVDAGFALEKLAAKLKRDNRPYPRRNDPAVSDLRDAPRCLAFELFPNDFGHAAYPRLAAQNALELALALQQSPKPDAAALAALRVHVPYTPKISKLRVGCTIELELSVDALEGAPADPAADRLWHVHPFGLAPITRDNAALLPSFDSVGELYIGLRDVAAPARLSLLMQLAAGSANPDLEPARVAWSYLDGNVFRALGAEAGLLQDGTQGLRNSGIVELSLPKAAPSTRLPAGSYWLRVAIEGDPASVCDVIAIRLHAVMARFDERDNAAEHYATPLPPGSVERLLEADARVAGIEQPFSSFGSRPTESPQQFYTRVSEQLRHKQRALSAWDYERLVLQRFPQIYKAKCLPAANSGEAGHVDVIVVPDIRDVMPSDPFAPKVSSDLLGEIAEFLRACAPATASVRVRNARYVPVKVRLAVRFKPDQDELFASARLEADLIRFLSPWAHGDDSELMIGGRIYANNIVDFVDRQDYVDFVASIELLRAGRPLAVTKLDYHVATDAPDQVLVAERTHDINVLSELAQEQPGVFSGIGYMKVGLDFVVAATTSKT